MRDVGLVSRAPAMHVLVGLAILAQTGVFAQESQPPEALQHSWRRLTKDPAPAANAKAFYQGIAGNPATPTKEPNAQAVIQANVSTTNDMFLGGMTNRNKAIITGVASGAGIAAVAGGIAIAVQQLNKHTKKEEAKRKGVLKKALLTKKRAELSTTPPTTTPTTTTTTSLAGDEIPDIVKVILGVLGLCCIVTFFAAVLTQLCKGSNKKRSAAKKTSSTRPIARASSRESLDSERSHYSRHRENSAYSTYSTDYSMDPQAYDSYNSFATSRTASVVPEYADYYAQPPGMVGYGSYGNEVGTMAPLLPTEPYLINGGSWQARPSSFDPYSYAREDPYTSHPSTQGLGYDPYGQAPYNSGHSGSHIPRTSPYHTAASSYGSDLYPADVYSGYL